MKTKEELEADKEYQFWFDEGVASYNKGEKIGELLGFLALSGGTKQDIIAFTRGFGSGRTHNECVEKQS